MSSIHRQSILRSTISYIGMLIGAFSTIFVYPLEIESYGLSQFIYSTAEFMVPALGLGIPFLTIKYFPYFQDKPSGNHGLLGILFLSVIISITISGILLWLFRHDLFALLKWLGFDTQLFEKNAMFIFLLSTITLFTGLIENYLLNFNRVLVPTLSNNLLQKIGLPLLIAGIYFGYTNEQTLKWGILVVAGLSLIILLIHLKYLDLLRLRIDWGFLRAMPLREMGVYVFLSLVSGVGYLLAFRIGNIMVPSLISTAQNGVYSIGNFISLAIEVPFLSLSAIIAPFFAGHIAKREWAEIAELYHRFSIRILIWGIFLFLGVLLCTDDLIQLMPSSKKMEGLKSVVLLLGLAKVVNMSVGLNLIILGFSRFYRYTLLSIILLAIINVTLNLTFIPKWGMVGAAFSIFIAIVLYNGINTLFFWLTFRIPPYKREVLGVFAIGIIIFLLIDFGIQASFHPFINILIRGTVLSVLYLGAVLWLRFSPELNDQIQKVWRRVRMYFKS